MKKKVMKRILSVFLCLSMLILTGCWNRKEAKSLAVIMSLVYDITRQGSYKITAEMLNPSAKGNSTDGGTGNSEQSSSIIITSEGNSLPETVRKLSMKTDKTVFASQNHARFFTEAFARTEMAPALDFFLRDHLTDESQFMVMIKGDDAMKLYHASPCTSSSIGVYLETLSMTQPRAVAYSTFVTTLDFAKDLFSEGKEPVMGTIEIIEKTTEETATGQTGNKKEYEIIYLGLAAFKDGKFMGYLNMVETRAYNLITGDAKTAFFTAQTSEGMSTLELVTAKTDIKTSIENGKVKLDVKLKLKTDILQQTGTLDITKMESAKKVEESLNRMLETEITDAVKRVQSEFGSDIFGFGNYFHIQHPKKWKELKSAWNQIFSQAELKVTVESFVLSTGEIDEPFQLEG